MSSGLVVTRAPIAEVPDPAEVLQLMEQIVHARPYGYTYPCSARDSAGNVSDGLTCWYVQDGKPSCLVGHVLHALGAPVEWLATQEGRQACEVYLTARGYNRMVQVALDSPDIVIARALQQAQSVQDSGKPWNDALLAVRIRMLSAPRA